MTNSTLASNSTGFDGGGIFNSGTLTVTNSTFVNNSAYPNYGGAIFNEGAATVTNSTIVHNTAVGGGGIGSFGGAVTLTNTLLAQNTGGDADTTTTANSANNLVDDNSTGLTNGVNGNLIGTNVTDVGLDPNGLQDNGGPTQTIALLSGSQAIDAGTNSVLGTLPTDQRGFGRLVGTSVDIGAYELQAPITLSPNPGGIQEFSLPSNHAGPAGRRSARRELLVLRIQQQSSIAKISPRGRYEFPMAAPLVD